MSKFCCPIVKFELRDHPNADSLSIAIVKDWPVVVKTKDFMYEDYGVYFPLDTIAPADHPLLSFLGGKKVRAAKFRGVVSMGVLLPLSQIQKQYPNVKGEEGKDLAEMLGVKKWKATAQLIKLFGGSAKSNVFVDGPEEFHRYMDIENIRNYPDVIKEGEQVYFSEKLHGTSLRAAIIDDEFYFGTRNTCLRTKDYISKEQKINWKNRSCKQKIVDWCSGKKLTPIPLDQETVWHKAIQHEDVEAKLRALRLDIILFAEIVGQGIQDLDYGFTRPKIFVYDIQVRNNLGVFRYLNHADTRIVCRHLFDVVPLLYVGPFDKGDVDIFKVGKNTISNSHVREGIVIEPVEPRFDFTLGRVKLKALSEDYLLRKNATDKEE